jgi:hypothetical protein
MNADAEFLVMNLLPQRAVLSEAPEFLRLRFNVHYLSNLDPDFATPVKELITIGTEKEIQSTKFSITMWMTDDEGLPALHNTIEQSGKDRTSGPVLTHYLLTEAIKRRSLECIRVGGNPRYPVLDRWHTFAISTAGHQGEELIREHGLTPQPDLLSSTNEEIDDYYHPIAVAARIIMPKGASARFPPDTGRFLLEYPAFKEWVTGQPDMDTALQQALDTKSIHPPTIKALSIMQNDTAAPLHEGLL